MLKKSFLRPILAIHIWARAAQMPKMNLLRSILAISVTRGSGLRTAPKLERSSRQESLQAQGYETVLGKGVFKP